MKTRRTGLDVVVEGVGLGVHDLLESVAVALKIGNEHLDLGVGHPAADLADGLREDERAAVREIVSVDRRDYGVAQPHLLYGVGHADGFEQVYSFGLAGVDGAVGACAGADVAKDHECGGAAVPALADVGTLGLSADGVELSAVEETLDSPVAVATGHLDFEPLGQPSFRDHFSPAETWIHNIREVG